MIAPQASNANRLKRVSICMFSGWVRRISEVDRARKRIILLSYDIVAFLFALWAAFSVRLGTFYWPDNEVVYLAAAISVAAGVLALQQQKVYRIVLRFFDLGTVSRIFFGAATASIVWVIANYFGRPTLTMGNVPFQTPRSVAFIYCGFAFVLLFMGRYAMSTLVGHAHRGSTSGPQPRRRNIAIYGANQAGISLAESVRRDPHYRLCAFIDDDPALHGQIIAGIPIFSSRALERLIEDTGMEEVFLAMPKASRSQRLAAISRLNHLKLKVKTVPAPEEIVSGRFTVSDVRPIEVNDLLRRDPVEPLTELIHQAVQGRSILITGAGGSIGSEICRQIVRAGPRRMVLLDHSEFGLYTIEQQLIEIVKGLDQPLELVPVMGSMLNEHLIRDVICTHQVDTIYHAAAYKHVPLLEQNEVIGVENNVVGTLVLARIAHELKLTRFTMISTDKAVRPESVMGASKRVAELVIQSYADLPDCATRFGIVRFGNVLDSSGSVVQHFRRQISKGGPVTVTHPDVTRFFMSIPEATQLVLQASAMAEGGEVFVLDMGESIRISELARNMISLSGMTVRDESNPNGDIEITFVGLRPGEKLYEELFVGSETLATPHPRIMKAKERSLSREELAPQLDRLIGAIRSADRNALRIALQDMVAPDAEASVTLSEAAA
jgi:FlaA1/EpsC-like NDP-sugar epimerase